MTIQLISIQKAKKKGKKYTANFVKDGKPISISFGADGYRDFTLLNKKGNKHYLEDKAAREKVKAAYLSRHRRNENWSKPDSAGSLSKWLLWNKPTFAASLRDFKKRFKF